MTLKFKVILLADSLFPACSGKDISLQQGKK